MRDASPLKTASRWVFVLTFLGLCIAGAFYDVEGAARIWKFFVLFELALILIQVFLAPGKELPDRAPLTMSERVRSAICFAQVLIAIWVGWWITALAFFFVTVSRIAVDFERLGKRMGAARVDA